MKPLTAIIIKEDKMYVARCTEVGIVSQGKTIKEATELYLEEFPAEVGPALFL